MLPQPAKPNRRQLTREDVLDVREVAELLHMPLSTIFDYARRGVIPGHKLGRRWVFLHEEIDAALRSAPRSAMPSPAAQPPGSHGPIRAKGTLKRYPRAVPYSRSDQQSLLDD
jgi:excisionase family DNA binding protein